MYISLGWHGCALRVVKTPKAKGPSPRRTLENLEVNTRHFIPNRILQKIRYPNSSQPRDSSHMCVHTQWI